MRFMRRFDKISIRIMVLAILFGLSFWLAESIFGYFYYSNRMRHLLIQAPLSLLDSLVFNIPALDLFVRLMFLLVCIISGLLLSRFVHDLRASQLLYQRLIENAPDGIYVEIQGNYVYLNPVAVKLFGAQSADELLGTPILERVEPHFQKLVEDRINQLRDKRVNLPLVEEVFLRLDQTPFDVEVSAVPIEWKGQTGALVFFRDVTERKRLAENMMQSEKMAELGTLAAGVAHEINSPLQVITGSSESILKDLEKNDIDHQRMQRSIAMINRNGWRVARIVRSLLAYARSTQDEFVVVHINRLVEDTLLLVEHQMRTWSNIIVHTDLADGLPQIKCDNNKIAQVLINLINNAADAMPSGGKITIRTRQHEKEHIMLQIEDSGNGIPPEIVSKIFDPFFTTKSVGSGTGLGLSIVSSILQAHGGTIDVHSTPGKGTRFTLLIPLEPPPTEEVGTPDNHRYPGPV